MLSWWISDCGDLKRVQLQLRIFQYHISDLLGQKKKKKKKNSKNKKSESFRVFKMIYNQKIQNTYSKFAKNWA